MKSRYLSNTHLIDRAHVTAPVLYLLQSHLATFWQVLTLASLLSVSIITLCFTSPAEGRPRACGPQPTGLCITKAFCICPPSEPCDWQTEDQPQGTPCGNGGTCSGGDTCNCPESGAQYVYPGYYVLGLVYAPPGCTASSGGCDNGLSSVSYTDASSLGTTTSTSNSFKADVKATFSVTIIGNGFDVAAGFAQTSETTDSVTIARSSGLAYSNYGGVDGVNHDLDYFILLENPAVGFTAKQVDSGNACVPNPYVASWYMGLSNLGPSGSATGQDITRVTVGDLKTAFASNPNLGQELQKLGLTEKDYQSILSLDPFSASGVIDQTRFVYANYNLPYLHAQKDPSCNPPGGICKCTPFTETVTNAFTGSLTIKAQSDYSASIKASAGFDLGVWKGSTSLGNTVTFTDSSSDTHMKSNSEAATATIGCSSQGYTGSPHILVYWDTLFGSFMFAPAATTTSLAIIQKGRVIQASGSAAVNASVALSYDGQTYHTVTDREGNYTIYGRPLSGAQGKLLVKDIAQQVEIGPSKESVIQLR